MKNVILVVMFLALIWEPAFVKPGVAEGTEAQSENSSWPITESKMVDRVQTKLISVAGDEPIVDTKGYVCEATFILAVSIIHGVATRCEDMDYSGGPFTLDECKLKTCELEGNAFDYNPDDGRCGIKRCAGASLQLSDDFGGYDVYALRDCAATEFTHATPSSAGLATNCEPIGGGDGYTLASCKLDTCLNGGDTFNWRATPAGTGECFYKLCQGTSLEFFDIDPGYDIYTMRDPY